MKIQSGYSFYGQNIGILVFQGHSPRIPGDAGHAETFSYPVCYEIVKGHFTDLIEGSEEIKAELFHSCRALIARGIRGIVGDCGLMSLYQQELSAELKIPFVGSSLCQIPMIWQMAGRQGSIGIITGHSDFLRETHLRNSGWDDSISLAVEGMQERPHFSHIVIHGNSELDPAKMRVDVLEAVRILKEKTPDLKAVVLECSNLATYSCDVARAFHLPVFDTISAANLLQYSLSPTRYM